MSALTFSLHRVPALDGLRTIAVFGVLLFHAGLTWMPGGFLGVDVFFVLSGYLITSLLLAERAADGRIDLARFWLRRARRLLPAVVVVVAACVLLAFALAANEAARVRGDALSSLLYFNNWHQIFTEQSYFDAAGRPSLLRHLWSLSVEEQFYVLWPLAIAFGLARLSRGRFLGTTLAVALLSALLMAVLFDPSGDPSRVYYGTDTRLTPLLLGAALAFVWPMRPARGRTGPRASAVLNAMALAGLAGVLYAFFFAHEFDSWLYRGGLTLVAGATAVLLAAIVHPACAVARPLASAPMVWLGERSYGIYLWHWPVMTLTRPEFDLSWSLWILVPLQLAATVGLAAASYRWVEMPFRRGEAQERIRGWMAARRPRQRLGVVLGTLVATLAIGVWLGSASSASEGPQVTESPAAGAIPAAPAAAPDPTRPASQEPPLAVGASVMLAAQDALEQRLGATVDAAVGRYASDVADRLEEYRRQKALPSRVVIQIGDNGPIRDEDLQRIRAALEDVERVVFVNVLVPRTWELDANLDIEAAVEDWPEARIADWRGTVQGDQLNSDRIHPLPAGAQVYARVVAEALNAP